MKSVGIIDYGLGNLGSVASAFETLGARVQICGASSVLKDLDCAVLPGVGAFEDGISSLKQAGWVETIAQFIESGKPFLGICLGAQLLLSESFEFGHHQGLGMIPGSVKALSPAEQVKVPHVGWASIRHPRVTEKNDDYWKKTMLEGVVSESEFYFVHSFACFPADENHVLAYASYGGQDFPAVVRRANVTGCQFHPEKSGRLGLRMLQSFLTQSFS